MNYISEYVIWSVNAVSLHKLCSSILDDISNVSLVLFKESVSESESVCVNLCGPW